MFGIDPTILAFVGFATIAAGGLCYAFLFERVSSEAKTEKRFRSIQAKNDPKAIRAASRANDVAKRRKTVQESLKELEEKQREKSKKRLGLKKLMQQAGLTWSMQQFFVLSFICGLATAGALFLSGLPIYIAGAGLLVGSLGLPRWIIYRMRKRRMDKFIEEFPNAVDVIVRGVKAGLPVNDCLSIVAKEARPPVSVEFSRLIEAQQLGMPLAQAVTRLYENIPLAEANFFAIVISIQQSAGGNLSEALSNLSAVLRDRKKMKAKISAMSAEAKASAGIIGALPFLVAFLVYLTTPQYIMILFTDPTGHIILICAGLWMSLGIYIMKKMISFDF
jgi:tight adherence protein B